MNALPGAKATEVSLKRGFFFVRVNYKAGLTADSGFTAARSCCPSLPCLN